MSFLKVPAELSGGRAEGRARVSTNLLVDAAALLVSGPCAAPCHVMRTVPKLAAVRGAGNSFTDGANPVPQELEPCTGKEFKKWRQACKFVDSVPELPDYPKYWVVNSENPDGTTYQGLNYERSVVCTNPSATPASKKVQWVDPMLEADEALAFRIGAMECARIFRWRVHQGRGSQPRCP